MSRIALIILGLLVAVMGVLGLIPSLGMGTEPVWHAVVKIVLGVIGVIIGAVDRRRA